MKKIIKISSAILAVFTLLISCESTELDIIDNPNGLSTDQSDPNFMLNAIQLNFADVVQRYGTTASEVSRINYMNGRNYFAAYDPAFFDGRWEDTYQGTIKNIKLLNQITQQRGFTKHTGMGQVFEAYLMVTLVDFFGDVPYTEAFDSSNLNPATDSGESIYNSALVLLDQAIVNFETISPQPTFDFYYQKDWSKWIKLANSLKLKIYMQRRLVDPNAIASFESIIAEGNYMTAVEDDFQFTWGTNNTNPDTRHPIYAANYTPTGAAGNGGYMSNWLMNQMKNKKSVIDPRMRFYFFRQVNDVPVSEQDLRCTVEPIPPHYAAGNHVYCRIDDNQGYWGRDHGNDEGLPPDGTKKTTYGLYPVGGRFDDDAFVQTNLNLGAKGNGITPIFLSSTVDFLRAEASLFGGSGDAKSFVLAGVQKSFSKVRSFIVRDANANTSFVPSQTVDSAYLNELNTLMDNAVGNEQKLNLIAKEFFVTLFGNGIDGYNFYRRTGAPTDIQPNLDPNPGAFIRSFFYPASEANTNTNLTQKNNVTTRVFWDTNPTTGFPVGN